MKSMTGYGAAKVSHRELDLDISIRAINGRFLESRVHLPREYAPFEGEIKKKLSAVFRRGTLDIYVSRRLKDPADQISITVQTEVAQQWMKAYARLAKELKLKGDVGLASIAGLPEVMKVVEVSTLLASEKKNLFSTLEQAIKACEAERIREGKALHKDLSSLVSGLSKHLKEMQDHLRAQSEGIGDRLKKRLSQAGLDEKMDQARWAQEVAIILDKSDISEEIARLAEHLNRFASLLAGADSQGKTLDFYTQELLREVNTIGSKSQSADLTAAVVSAKTMVEKIREQVQNVE